MKRHLAVLTAVLVLAGVAACDKDSDKDTPKPATSTSAPSGGPDDPAVTGPSKPPLPTPSDSVPGVDHRSESPAAS